MSNVKPQDVKKLRDSTGVGFGDCKKALEETNGDFKAAEKKLKEMGLAQVAKRADKLASEGRVFIAKNEKSATIIELSCNTDFVAKNEDFVNYGQKIADLVNEGNDKDSDIVKNNVLEVNTKCKENIELRFSKTVALDSIDSVGAYIHGEMGSVGCLVVLSGSEKNDALAKDIALHVVAFKPQYLDFGSIPSDILEEQKEIFTKQVIDSGKPQNIAENIVKGKLDKYFKELCLLEQSFVKDESKTISQVLGKEMKIKEFILKEKGL